MACCKELCDDESRSISTPHSRGIIAADLIVIPDFSTLCALDASKAGHLAIYQIGAMVGIKMVCHHSTLVDLVVTC